MQVGDESSLQTGMLTAVGIDKDKNSQQALKWTVDHLVDNQTVILIHVRSKSSTRNILNLSFDSYLNISNIDAMS